MDQAKYKICQKYKFCSSKQTNNGESVLALTMLRIYVQLSYQNISQICFDTTYLFFCKVSYLNVFGLNCIFCVCFFFFDLIFIVVHQFVTTVHFHICSIAHILSVWKCSTVIAKVHIQMYSIYSLFSHSRSLIKWTEICISFRYARVRTFKMCSRPIQGSCYKPMQIDVALWVLSPK